MIDTFELHQNVTFCLTARNVAQSSQKVKDVKKLDRILKIENLYVAKCNLDYADYA